MIRITPRNSHPNSLRFRIALAALTASLAFMLGCGGCAEIAGYSNSSLFPDNVRTVCIQMFHNQTFRRDVEFELTDALAKRIETETPYKIVSSRDRADTIISGRIVSMDEFVLTTDRNIGTALEKEFQISAVVNWKNLNSGAFLLENQRVSATATYSSYQNQDIKYASTIAANNLARNIVELMENKW